MELNNIVGFKAIDKDGNEQNVTVDEMVDMVATRMVSALPETSSLSEISTLATAAATGNDVYENELPTVTDAANVRVLQSSGDAAQMTMQSLATKLGELMNNLKLYPFMVRKVINDDTDLNAVTKNGIYQLIGASGNNTPIRWGILLIFGYGGYLFQILSNVSTDTVVVKLRIGNEIGFSDWKTVSLT